MSVPAFTHGLFRRMRQRRRRSENILKLIEAIQGGASLFMNPVSAKMFPPVDSTTQTEGLLRSLGTRVYFTPYVKPGHMWAIKSDWVRREFQFGFPNWRIETKIEKE